MSSPIHRLRAQRFALGLVFACLLRGGIAPGLGAEPAAPALPEFPSYPPPVAALAADSDGLQFFASWSPLDFRSLLAERKPDTVVSGRLYLPEPQLRRGPLPAMVILHGSSGVAEEREVMYAKLLAQNGIAGFVVDSFAARGIRPETPCSLKVVLVSEADLLADAYAALRLLQTDPAIDPAQIGVMGFSYGGTASRLAVDERFYRRLASDIRPFVLHVDFYGPTYLDINTRRTTSAPVLTLRGALDQSNDLVDCARTEQQLRQAGSPVESRVFSDAGHGWELNREQKFWESLNPVACRLEMNEVGDLSYEGKPIAITKTGEREEKVRARMALLRTLQQSCMQRGYVIGRNERAFTQAKQALLDFVVSRTTPSQPAAVIGSR